MNTSQPHLEQVVSAHVPHATQGVMLMCTAATTLATLLLLAASGCCAGTMAGGRPRIDATRHLLMLL
jgi:hypothetical protein